MRVVIQKVKQASVSVDNEVISSYVQKENFDYRFTTNIQNQERINDLGGNFH